MSWFGGNNAPAAPPQQAGPSIIEAARTEMEMTTDLFNKFVFQIYHAIFQLNTIC